MPAWTVARLLAVTGDYLAGKGVSSPRLDAELLLARTLGVDRVALYTDHDRPVSAAELDAYRELIARRARREPVAYLLGTAAFRYLELAVSPAVLIPRPETEELVDLVLDWLREHPILSPSAPAIADVGTGSGAIALSVASEAGVAVLALDRSSEALEVARRNAERLGLTGLVSFAERDLLDEVPAGSLRVVVSNPPYVAEEDYAGLQPEVRDHEPRQALAAGPGGLDVYRRLVPQAAVALGPGGVLFLEIGADQAAAVQALALAAGFGDVEVRRDLSGKERLVRATRPGTWAVALDALDEKGSERLAAALRAGAIVGLPTDTVYGLAAAWDSATGVSRLAQAKGRAPEQPLAVLFPSVKSVLDSLPDLDPPASRVLRRLLPGPYTFVVSTGVSRLSSVGTEESLGVRVPDHEPLLGFLAALGIPLAATSANLTGREPPGSLEEADPDVLSACAVALVPPASAPASARVASTVVDLRPLGQGKQVVVLRAGAVSLEDVLRAVDGALG